jgi:Ca2+-binding EF-hand superfamily protein
MCPQPIDGFAKRAFQRIDRNADGEITGKEIKQRLKEIGVPAGPFGMVHSGAVDAFMGTFDKSGNGKIELDEFTGESRTFLPKGIYDEQGNLLPDRLESEFFRTDANHDGRLTVGEIKAQTLQDLNAAGVRHAKYKADIAAKFGVDVLDQDRDAAVTLKELRRAAEEAAGD